MVCFLFTSFVKGMNRINFALLRYCLVLGLGFIDAVNTSILLSILIHYTKLPTMNYKDDVV